MKILVVDDEPVSRTKALVLLAKYGECDFAVNGEQAWEKFEQAHENMQPYDLLTMDIDMPGMNGHQVLKKIRKWENAHNTRGNCHDAKILMVTGMRRREDIVTSFHNGCEWFITKPITPENLEKALSQVAITTPVA